MSSLQLHQVVKRFGATTVVREVDLAVNDGEFVVFVGPSGCGKSTLLRMIAGLESVSAGDILIDGRRVNDISAAQRGLAMVFQSYALYPHMTVYQNLAFGLENLRTARAEIDSKVKTAAKMLKLDKLLERRPTQLSGGQRQRVAIGRAIVRDPTVFLFDEPLSNLDAELRVQMRSEIIALHRRLGTTMIYVTHDQVEAMTMADRIVVLRDGRAEQVGTPLELYNHPANRFVAGFIGSPQMNFLAARVVATPGDGVRIALDAAPDAASEVEAWASGKDVTDRQRIFVGIRPEHVVLGSASTNALQVNVVIDQVEQLGAVTFLYCSLPNGERLTVYTAGQQPYASGSPLTVSLPLMATHIFDTTAGEPALVRR